MKTKSSRALTVSLIAAVLLATGSYVLGWSSLLAVRSIELIGAPTEEAKQVLIKSLDVSVGEKMARVDPRSLSRRLAANNWVESSKISRDWLSGKVEIQISPRVPVALFTEPGKPQVALDAYGKTFLTPAKYPEGLPKVTATSVDSGLAAIKVFTELPIEFSSGIDRLSAARPTNLLIYGTFSGRNLRVIWGDGDETDLKIKVINALLEEPMNKNIKMIDVTAPHAPIVK
jgi:cell division septal protein FtsQ